MRLYYGILLLLTVAAHAQQPCRYIGLTIISFRADGPTYASDARATCYSEWTSPIAGQFRAVSWVVDETVHLTVGESFCQTCNSRYGETVWTAAVGGTTSPTHCYRARMEASSSFYEQGIGSALSCAPGTSGGTTPEEDQACTVPEGCNSPILIDLGRHAYQLTSAADGVWFDLRNDGHPIRIGWTRAGVENAFLALDRNGNGRIDNGGELFGNFTPLQSGSLAPNGFAALNDLDANEDAIVDSADPAWPHLLLWVDRDHDGSSTGDELQPIAGSVVTGLETEHRYVGRRDPWGNLFRFMSHVRTAEGRRSYYDVFLVD